MCTFDNPSEIEEWLRSQWAGLYRDLLARMHQQKQIASLSDKVSELIEITKTLRRYLEDLVEKADPIRGAKIVNQESERLKTAELRYRLRANKLLSMVTSSFSDEAIDYVVGLLREANSLEDLRHRLEKLMDESDESNGVFWHLFDHLIDEEHHEHHEYLSALNDARKELGLKPYQLPGIGATMPG